MRFGPKNFLECTTTTTGTGSYVLGNATAGHASFLTLADGTVLPCSVRYGLNREAGMYTKQGSLLVRTRILESTNGNGPVDWPAGSKTITCDWLAQNVAKSSDNSIVIEDDPEDGKTNFRGLKISDVAAWFSTNATAGIDLQITNVGGVFTFNVLRKIKSDGDGSAIIMSMAAADGSTHIADVGGNRQLKFENAIVGQEFTVKLDYDAIGNRKPLWPDQEANPTAVIEWVNGYRPEFTPVARSSDTFQFQRIGTQNVTWTTIVSGNPVQSQVSVPKYLGWILSTERPVILTGDASADVTAAISTVANGVPNGPNEQQWLSATIDSDYMDYSLVRTGTVTGGTFDLTIGLSPGINIVYPDIPFDVTAYELLTLIWAETQLDETEINVDGGVDGADATRRLTDSAARMRLEFIGFSRYSGYVISVDDSNLTGGGSYSVDAVDSGSGSQTWPFVGAATMRFSFNGNSTGDVVLPAGNVTAALEALPGIGVGNIRVVRSNAAVFMFEFIGALRGTNIAHEIQFTAGHLPYSNAGAATGQRFSTARNGSGPQGANETQRLTITGNPVDGEVIVTFFPGQPAEVDVTIPVTATSAAAQALVDAALGAGNVGNVIVTGGALPGTPLVFEFAGDYQYTNVVQSTVDDSGAGAEAIDWSICEGKVITLRPGNGEYRLRHINPIPGKTLHVTLTSDSAAGTLVWDSVLGIPVDWDGSPPSVPADGDSVYLEFYAESISDIKGKNWFHTGEGGGGGNLADQLVPGIDIEIEHDVEADTFTIDNLRTTHIDTDGPTIVCDISADIGTDHEVTINGDRDLDVVNEKLGELWRLKVTQGAAGSHHLNYLFDIEWAEGFEPVLTTVPGKADLFEFLCLEVSGPYNVARFKAWVETTERPQPLSDTADAIAANEVQSITSSQIPISGTWTIRFQGFTTDPIPFDANANLVRLFLQSLLSIGSGNVLVTGGTLGVSPFRVEFVNALGGQNLPQLSVQSNLRF